MIYAFSKNLDKSQQNYSVTDKELLAVVKGIEYFRHYFLGREFVLRTDHKALTFLNTCKNPSGRMLRWAMKLQEYSFTIECVQGESNIADGLSRKCFALKTLAEVGVIEDLGLRARILEEYHVGYGHGCPNAMKFLLKEKYKWPGMFQEVDELYSNCGICLRAGGPRLNTKHRIISSKGPNDIWECDLVGRIPSNEGAYKFIFIAIDH